MMLGSPKSAGQALPIATAIYRSLRAMAQHHLAGERRDHTLQPTALAHEAYLRLHSYRDNLHGDSAQFLITASGIMRGVLVDHARRRAAQKRGGGIHRSGVSEALIQAEQGGVDLLVLDETLNRLRAMDQQLARIVELRYFGGLSDMEIARVLDCSTRSIRRAWSVARAWLARELRP